MKNVKENGNEKEVAKTTEENETAEKKENIVVKYGRKGYEYAKNHWKGIVIGIVGFAAGMLAEKALDGDDEDEDNDYYTYTDSDTLYLSEPDDDDTTSDTTDSDSTEA